MSEIITPEDIKFLIKMYCVKFWYDENQCVPPPRGCCCYHHDGSKSWDRLIMLKLIKSIPNEAWTYVHKLTPMGYKTIITELNIRKLDK